MIAPADFFSRMTAHGFDFFAGVPDSLLKSFCFYVADHLSPDQHVITANEGSAIALAAGYNLATGKVAAVYMQNSGIGNAINPLLSLADSEVYSIPMLLIIGWRGEPGKPDEPQHKKQGRVLRAMLDAMEIRYSILDAKSDQEAVLADANRHFNSNSSPYALVVRDGTFADYKYKGKADQASGKLTRERAIQILADHCSPSDVIVSTTGKASRELYESRTKSKTKSADFLTVGAMGHCNQIALGIAISRKDQRVICLDGDGAILMHMGSLPIIGALKPQRFKHVILNNRSHESVGGQPTVAGNMDFEKISLACGYQRFMRAEDEEELQKVLPEFLDSGGTSLLEIQVSAGARPDLGRPKHSPLENKMNFIEALGRG